MRSVKRMKPRDTIDVAKTVFNYLLALLVIIPITNEVGFLPKIGIDLLYLAVVTTIVGIIGYSRELWESLTTGESTTSKE